jgi:RNA recognition motif-containing protein
MNVNIYVGNLPFSVNNDQLTEMFAKFGQVSSARVVQDQHSGRSKGFGFVEMDSPEEAKKAIEELDNSEFDGRPIKVNEARPREDRPARSGGGAGRGGYRDRNGNGSRGNY